MPLFDLSARAKLRVTGSDRVRFLNGQMTNDVRKANAHLSMPACVLNTKGKVDALVYINAGAEELLLDADPELREKLAARLERYVIADDVTIEDVTEELSLFHLTGETEPTVPNDAAWRRSKRFGTVGWDLFVEAAEHDRLLKLLSAQEPICSADEAERRRIEEGIPRWGHELTDQIIPVEANLESDAIDYAKGCYIGQEVISRMKMSGQTNKRLCGLVSIDGTPLSPTMRLSPAAGSGVTDPGKDVGWITSATRSDRLGKEIALGFVKRGSNDVGTELSARLPEGGGNMVAVEVVALPFA
ncbi:MAG: folate-binding protein YgfZ [Chthoniobacterales bacterium]|nr:folate-binding protein YgfZ [Chthoniobacterales bacterium]